MSRTAQASNYIILLRCFSLHIHEVCLEPDDLFLSQHCLGTKNKNIYIRFSPGTRLGQWHRDELRTIPHATHTIVRREEIYAIFSTYGYYPDPF